MVLQDKLHFISYYRINFILFLCVVLLSLFFTLYFVARELMVYSPSNEQPLLDREWHDLTPAEQEVDAFFSNPVNIDKLIKFFCLEENKGKDKYNGFRFLLYKVFLIY